MTGSKDKGKILDKGTRKHTEIVAVDKEVGKYQIRDVETKKAYATIKFQEGPVLEAKRNGIFVEDLLRLAEHKLGLFQGGKYPSKYNAEALLGIDNALRSLALRRLCAGMADRERRGVEGTSKA